MKSCSYYDAVVTKYNVELQKEDNGLFIYSCGILTLNYEIRRQMASCYFHNKIDKRKVNKKETLTFYQINFNSKRTAMNPN